MGATDVGNATRRIVVGGVVVAVEVETTPDGDVKVRGPSGLAMARAVARRMRVVEDERRRVMGAIPPDTVEGMIGTLIRDWLAKRMGGEVRAGDVARRRGGIGIGVEYVVDRIDRTVHPPAAWCGFGEPGAAWDLRPIPVDDLVVVRRGGRESSGDRDEVADAIAAAVDAAIALDDPRETAAALILVLMRRTQGAGMILPGIERLMFP